jgi:hypothetical protein
MLTTDGGVWVASARVVVFVGVMLGELLFAPK